LAVFYSAFKLHVKSLSFETTEKRCNSNILPVFSLTFAGVKEVKFAIDQWPQPSFRCSGFQTREHIVNPKHSP